MGPLVSLSNCNYCGEALKQGEYTWCTKCQTNHSNEIQILVAQSEEWYKKQGAAPVMDGYYCQKCGKPNNEGFHILC